MTGITFEEKLLDDYDAPELISRLESTHSIRHLEISLAEETLPKASLDLILKSPFRFSYHVPYQLEKLPLEAALLKTYPRELMQSTRKILDFSSHFQRQGPLTVVIHPSQDKSLDSNLKYLDFLLEYLAKKDLDLVLSLENIHNDYTTYTPEDVHEIVRKFATDRLGICLDVPNALIAGAVDPPAFTDALNHYHLHGFTREKKHLALDQETFTRSRDYLAALPPRTMVLELLGTDHYFAALENSLNWLRQMKTGP